MEQQARKAPSPTGQVGEVLNLLRQHAKSGKPLYSLTLTGNYSIPEAASRIHELRGMGFNIISVIHPAVYFRGKERRRVAQYVLGTPEWPRPGYGKVEEAA
ncbi:hypothetical protein VI06_20630 [Aquitalea magnusonii]|nr:hypothetical protein VI06_20630 [Aquitalea magnusonii]